MTADSRIVNRYFATRARLKRLVAWQEALFDGVWLGVLTPARNRALDEFFYLNVNEEHHGEPMQYASEAYVRRGLEDWEVAFLDRHELGSGSRVLVTSAGSGREVLHLLQRGCDAIGYEPNAQLVDTGREVLAAEGYPDRLEVCERDAFPGVGETADAVVIGWASFMHIAGRDRRVAFLRDAGAALRPGGALLVSVWARPEHSRHAHRVHRIAAWVRRARRAEPVELGDGLIDSFTHEFTLAELEGEVRDAGFAIAGSGAEPYGWVDARQAG